MAKIHTDAPREDFTPNLIVTHMMADTEGKYFLFLWHAQDHHIYAFDSEEGITRVKGLEQEFDTYEAACRFLEEVTQLVPMPQSGEAQETDL